MKGEKTVRSRRDRPVAVDSFQVGHDTGDGHAPEFGEGPLTVRRFDQVGSRATKAKRSVERAVRELGQIRDRSFDDSLDAGLNW